MCCLLQVVPKLIQSKYFTEAVAKQLAQFVAAVKRFASVDMGVTIGVLWVKHFRALKPSPALNIAALQRLQETMCSERTSILDDDSYDQVIGGVQRGVELGR